MFIWNILLHLRTSQKSLFPFMCWLCFLILQAQEVSHGAQRHIPMWSPNPNALRVPSAGCVASSAVAGLTAMRLVLDGAEVSLVSCQVWPHSEASAPGMRGWDIMLLASCLVDSWVWC